MASRMDFTGRESERLRELHREELRARQGQIGTVNEVPPTEEDPNVVYGLDGEPLAEVPDVVELDDNEPVYDLKGEPLEPPTPRRKLQRRKQIEDVPAPVLEEPGEVVATEEPKPQYRVMRVNTDIEQMTYGVGTSYDFQRGKKYYVPSDIYRHLDSKGLVVH
jgi:hypothetical protein